MLEVLVADDDENVRVCVASALITAGHRVTEAIDGAHAVELMASRAFDLAICDVHMPKLGGLQLARRIRRDAPETAIVLMTGFGEAPEAVGSMSDGAVDVVTKPFDPDEFARVVVAPIAEQRALKKRLEVARATPIVPEEGPALVAVSVAMQGVVERIRVFAHTDTPALVSGEAGTGKDLVARAIHAAGPRSAGPFVVAEGAALRDSLHEMESSLRAAKGGSLVLDGIEQLSLRAQIHLLRVIDVPGGAARRGPSRPERGARLITLTRERLPPLATSSELLDSLHHRLNGVRIHVPALRERAADLGPLVAQILEELSPPAVPRPEVTAAAWQALASHPFPGNVRELKSVLRYAARRAAGGAIDVPDLPAEIVFGQSSAEAARR